MQQLLVEPVQVWVDVSHVPPIVEQSLSMLHCPVSHMFVEVSQ